VGINFFVNENHSHLEVIHRLSTELSTGSEKL